MYQSYVSNHDAVGLGLSPSTPASTPTARMFFVRTAIAQALSNELNTVVDFGTTGSPDGSGFAFVLPLASERLSSARNVVFTVSASLAQEGVSGLQFFVNSGAGDPSSKEFNFGYAPSFTRPIPTVGPINSASCDFKVTIPYADLVAQRPNQVPVVCFGVSASKWGSGNLTGAVSMRVVTEEYAVLQPLK